MNDFGQAGLLTLWLLGAVVLGGCTAQRADMSPCSSLRCLAQAQVEEVRRSCVSDLFSYEQSRRRQKEIDALYGYPFLSWENFNDWRRYGGDGPSPLEWCRDYAQRKVRPFAFMGR